MSPVLPSSPTVLLVEGYCLRCAWEYERGERATFSEPDSPDVFMIHQVELLNPDGSVAANLTGLLEELGGLEALERRLVGELGGAFHDPPELAGDRAGDLDDDTWKGERF